MQPGRVFEVIVIVNLLENGLVSSEVFAGSGECRALKEADFQVGLL